MRKYFLLLNSTQPVHDPPILLHIVHHSLPPISNDSTLSSENLTDPSSCCDQNEDTSPENSIPEPAQPSLEPENQPRSHRKAHKHAWMQDYICHSPLNSNLNYV